jgi:uncharacterized protein (TIGR02271 family)
MSGSTSGPTGDPLGEFRRPPAQGHDPAAPDPLGDPLDQPTQAIGGTGEPTQAIGRPDVAAVDDQAVVRPGEASPVEDGSSLGASVMRHEEQATVGTETHESGRVRVRKHVETTPVEEVVSRSVEHADTSERVPALEGDSGEVETLPDGSVSIPVFEEVLVVTKKLVVRERVIVRKHTVVDEHTLETELRRERVTVEADDGVEVEERGVVGTAGVPPTQ